MELAGEGNSESYSSSTTVITSYLSDGRITIQTISDIDADTESSATAKTTTSDRLWQDNYAAGHGRIAAARSSSLPPAGPNLSSSSSYRHQSNLTLTIDPSLFPPPSDSDGSSDSSGTYDQNGGQSNYTPGSGTSGSSTSGSGTGGSSSSDGSPTQTMASKYDKLRDAIAAWDSADKGFDLTGTVTETSDSNLSHKEQLSQSSEDLMRMEQGRKVGAVQVQASSLTEHSHRTESSLSIKHETGRKFRIDEALDEVTSNRKWTDKQISTRSEYREYAGPTIAPSTTMAALRNYNTTSSQSLLGAAPSDSTVVFDSVHTTTYVSPLADVTKTVTNWMTPYVYNGEGAMAPVQFDLFDESKVNVTAEVTKIGYVFNGSSTLRSKSTFRETDFGTVVWHRGRSKTPASSQDPSDTYYFSESISGGIAQTLVYSKPAIGNSITLPGQGTTTTVAPGGEIYTTHNTLQNEQAVQIPLAEFVGQFSTKTGYVSLSAAGESASSGEYHSQTGGGNAGNNQNTSNPTETLDDDWLLPDEANRREDSGLLDLTPESAFNKMVSDPMFRAMLEQFLRNRATWPDPDVMSDRSIWDSCMQLYWRVKFHQTLSAAEKARFESSLNGATEDNRNPLCDHWVFWFAPESVRLFVLAPEAAAEIAQQRSARAALVGKLASADSKAHYRELMNTYRSGKYTNEMLNSTAGVYGEHFLAVLGVPLKGTQLAKEAVENVGGLASGVNKVDNAPISTVERGWLQFWEGRGIGNSRGHVIAQHVGKSDADLIARIGSNKKISAASSFTDQATAEAVIGGAIRQNRTQLSAWLRTAQQGDRLPLPYSGTDVIGRGIKKGQSVVGDRTNAKIILQALGDGKYHILTAFPQ